ncbi:p21 activated protein kinase inhibitor Skb15 [Schizosaccharomyces pombe]|uniref:Shk1 kinase-binding protein 15 n=1 Tax=Schizosaccharomyces pombe (strain 972 / ATCC 24843) TaxID=284812 RepID=SKB15_SCHPO|nr:p21-activated protein kinase inhibitor Skb15 [Schizosaccharomyces pombe]O74453.1 RecName: Full=Shk1 kinase-binding protein 15 [Schizosaccharomyces pombe 972h-]CAA20747.1 p21 activated protein kinase inhibitor Skb15 [Schizosaccharomyces pombe]|eukprot:NP_587918.1 p21-activated protein kinase inhibitor Skb15 [Schizosaccharomyces pombe]
MLRFVVGTYTHLIYGVDADIERKKCKPLWLFEAHEGALTALAVDGIYLASTSSDETIKIFDHTRNVQIADVSVPTDIANACIRDMCFTKNHLLACHDNGQISMWSKGSWLLVHTLKSSSHKGITGIAVHPSEKLALTVGGDGKLRLWDLVRGKGGKVLPLSTIPESILFLNESSFVIMSRRGIDAFKLDLTSLFSFSSKSQLNALCLYQSKLIVGRDNGTVLVLDTSDGKILHEFTAHKKRVKSVYPVDDYLITASSDGSVCIWDKDWNLVIEHNIPEGNRITCMVAMLADSNSEPKNVEDEAAKRQSLDSETSETSSESESESEYYSTSKQPPVKRTKHA